MSEPKYRGSAPKYLSRYVTQNHKYQPAGGAIDEKSADHQSQ